MPRRALEELAADECRLLLRQQVIGRLLYSDEWGPAAVPVNYAVAGEAIVFRSAPGTKIRATGTRVGFQVDQIDPDRRSGWSVLVRGTAEQVPTDRLPELFAEVDGDLPLPWKKGVHGIWVKIIPTAVTGRRLAGLVEEDFF